MPEGLVLWGVKSIYYILDDETKNEFKCTIKGKILETDFDIRSRYEMSPLVVGDRVVFEKTGIDSGLISKRQKRKNEFKRLKSNGRVVQTVFANIDYMIIIDSIDNPPLRPYFIDRCLFSADYMNIDAVIVFNKIDLIDKQNKELFTVSKKAYKKLGYAVMESSVNDAESINNLKKLTAGKVCSFYGRSGVGKSSLIKAIDPEITDIKIGEINKKYDRGNHTTSFSKTYFLKSECIIIDTPGVRELSIFIDSSEEVEKHIRDFIPFRDQCKYQNCQHINEPKCRVIEAVKQGEMPDFRYESYLRIRSTIEKLDDSKIT